MGVFAQSNVVVIQAILYLLSASCLIIAFAGIFSRHRLSSVRFDYFESLK